MAEVKNAFIRSKMNKDLDSRLLPSGEYRHAQNAQVSKSEGSDVGALENILGNIKIADLTQNIPNVSSIGYFADDSSSTVYVFLTDNTSDSYIPTGVGSNHFIYKYNIATGTSTKLVEGAFLNFSKSNPIFGVNILEDLLFWTDNRNQPRKINVQKTLGYYTNEDQISVAKYYPFQSIELFKESDIVAGEYETTMKDVVSKSLPNGGSASVSSAVTNSSSFDIQNLSIPTFPNELKSGFTVGYVDQQGAIVDTNQTVDTYADPTLTLTGNVSIPLVGSSTELVFNINPYYESDYSGDIAFLEDKFIRFSYRFKFDDGEYSLIAPFTQPCFIPKQDGYFLNTEVVEAGPGAGVSGDENEAISSTVVAFMENKVNNIHLQVPLPYSKDTLKSDLHVDEIDIIYKESDGLALQVIETIKVDQNFTGASTVLDYDYQAKKPYKTLPEKEITRVYDKVPLKAFSQEVISNRIVYGNYLNKPTPPQFINYNVTATEKFDFDITENKNRTSVVEYPSSSLKTNRNYQVGFVLADRFGRQSSVIISSNERSITVGTTTYTGSTLYSPYISEEIGVNIDSWKGNSIKILLNDPIPGGSTGLYNNDTNSINYNPNGWYSYKVVVKQTQQDYYNVYTCGAVKGDPFDSSEDLNYTYVSLQSDNINKVPRDLSEVGPLQKQFRSSVKLYGRVNIDNRLALNEGGDNSQFYPGKTFFTSPKIQDMYETFGVDRSDSTTWPGGSIAELSIFQNSTSNPLLSSIITSQDPDLQFGIVYDQLDGGYSTMTNLAVLETAPEESRLDIFWETSTSGVINDINVLAAGSDNLVAGFSSSYNDSGFDESLIIDDNVSSASFTLVDSVGANILAANIDSFNLDSVFTTQTTPLDVSSYFELYEVDPALLPGFYNIKVTSDFVDNVFYGSNQGLRVWNFTFTAVIDGVVNIIEKQIDLSNVVPVMVPTGTLSIDTDGFDSILTTLTATNGASADNPHRGEEINWFIHSQSGANAGTVNYFSVSFSNTERLSTCNLLNDLVGILPSDVYTVVLRAEDAGGLFDEIIITINSSIRVNYVRQYDFTVTGTTYYFTLINAVDSTDPNKSGYYAYLDTWGNLAGLSLDIDLDYTNSAKTGCPISPNKWIFKASESTAINQAKECLLTGYQGAVNFNPIDISGYTFEIV